MSSLAEEKTATKTAPPPSDVIERPVLTFPDEVSNWVIDHYQNADVILEYGSGGSTIAAAEMSGKTIFSVESDAGWVKKMNNYLSSAKPASMPYIHYANIGVTGKWGKPVNHKAYRRYHQYPISIWDHENFVQPDLVLIDGRFRAACALTVMLRTEKEIPLLFDDYSARRAYHIVEDFLEFVEIKGRMAKFIVRPVMLDPKLMGTVIGQFSKVF